MKKGLALFFLAIFAVSCPAQDTAPPPLPSWNADAQKAWWAQNPTPDKWPQAVKDLTAQLAANYAQNGASTFSNSDFQGWLEHLEWIQLGVANPDVVSSTDNLKAFVELGQDETISHLFIEKLDPHDVKKQALINLIQLDQAGHDDLHEYAALGVAYCLVFDQPFPRYWPHPQVAHDAVPIGDLDITKRFAFYVQANRDKKLDNDLTQLTFENLKFMVDSEVKLSELAYAQVSTGPPQGNGRIPYSSFQDAFFAIVYNTARMSTGNMAFMWDHPNYGLADIENNGGICVDQAYYAATLGKGRGIPTLYFQGQGADGGHAWFGYLSRSGKWELDCGRYESQNYPKGFAHDPQTWKVIDDTMLTNFFKNGNTSPNFQPAQNAIAWAQLQQDGAASKKILDDARTIMPELAQTWETEAALLEKIHASNDDKKSFYQDWIAQFGTFPDMKVEGQRYLLAVLKASNDPDADSLQQDILLANRGSDFDVGIQAAASALEDKVKSGDWDAARLAYETTIRDFGDQGGGTLFYEVINPYIESCLKAGQLDQAERAITFTEDRMPLDSSSIIGVQFNDLKGEVDDQLRKAAAK